MLPGPCSRLALGWNLSTAPEHTGSVCLESGLRSLSRGAGCPTLTLATPALGHHLDAHTGPGDTITPCVPGPGLDWGQTQQNRLVQAPIPSSTGAHSGKRSGSAPGPGPLGSVRG